MKNGLLLILLLHLLLYTALSLNIPVARQVIVFIYATIIPGFVVLKILNLNIRTIDRILLSIGLSLSLLMFTGLVLNSLYVITGLSQPLSFTPLLIMLSLVTLGLTFIAYRKNPSDVISDNKYLSVKNICTIFLFAVPFILALVGAVYNDTFILILMIISVSILFALAPTRLIPTKLYPFLILAVSLSLAYHFSLITPNLRGSDINLEYYVYRITESNGYWTTIPATTPITVVDALYSGCLSVTILPTIYSVLMNFGGELFFKIFYPFVFSLVPLILFRIYEGRMTTIGALASALFFVSGFTVFYGMQPLSVGRQIIAVFFMMLSIFILLNRQISSGRRKGLFIIFSMALIVSHYSTAFLYLATLLIVYGILRLRHNKHEVLNSSLLALILVFLIAWSSFAYIGQQPLVSLLDVFNRIYSNFFLDFSSSSARSSDIFAAHPIMNVPSLLNWAFLYAANFLVIIGALYLVFKPRKNDSSLLFRSLVFVAIALLLLCIAVPNLAPALQFGRFYSITLLFLAPCLFFGIQAISGLCKSLSSNIGRRVKSVRPVTKPKTVVSVEIILVTILLIGYLLTQTGFVNKVAGGSPISIPLDYDEMYASSNYVSRTDLSIQIHPQQDYLSVNWLAQNTNGSSIIYGDATSVTYLLHAYGLIPMENLHLILNYTIPPENAYIYLRSLNLNDQVIDARLSYPFQIFNVTENAYLTENMSGRVYSNGQSEILTVP